MDDLSYGDGKGLVPPRHLGYVADAPGIHSDSAFCRMEETEDELQQGAFAAPVVSHNGNIGTLRHLEGNVLQKPGLFPGVGEIKMVYGQHDGSFT